MLFSKFVQFNDIDLCHITACMGPVQSMVLKGTTIVLKVYPPDQPREDIANELLSVSAPGGAIDQLFTSGDQQSGLTAVYSATSMLNVPPDWVSMPL